MKSRLEDLPQINPKLGDIVRAEVLGKMASTVIPFPKGTDLCPLLGGLRGDHCQCPHCG